jgi:DNA-binding transcriptional LysR family regulator
MTLAQLRYFCTAARLHSITQAADSLFVTQPTISIAIRDLEKEFGIPLFAHKSGRLQMTEEGALFYEKASAILAMCDELRAEYSVMAAHKSRVRIGIPPLLSTVFFPDLLTAFHKEYPDIWLELQEYGSVRACTLVQDEVLDAALVNMEMPDIEKHKTLTLLTEPLYFAVMKGHPLEHNTSVSLKDLDGQPLILYNQDSVQNQILQTRFEAQNIYPRIILKSSQIPTIANFLRDGRCGCFLYKDILPQLPEVIGIPLEPSVETKAGLVWKRGRYISKGLETFISFCKEYYGNSRPAFKA